MTTQPISSWYKRDALKNMDNASIRKANKALRGWTEHIYGKGPSGYHVAIPGKIQRLYSVSIGGVVEAED